MNWRCILLLAVQVGAAQGSRLNVGAAQDMTEIGDFVAAKERKEKRSWDEANCAAEERRRRAQVGANQDMTAEPSV